MVRLHGRTRLGAMVKRVDDPRFPMDDYYTNGYFSFVRVECPAASGREVLELRFEDLRTPDLTGKGKDLIQRSEQLPDRILLYTDAGEELAEILHEEGLRSVSQLVRRSSLEDVFLRLTGRRLIE